MSNICVRCGSDQAGIRDIYGYSVDMHPDLLRGKIEDERMIFYCLPCAKEWLFPLIDERCGNTTTQILMDITKDDVAQHKNLKIPRKPLRTSEGWVVPRPVEIDDLVADNEKS